MIKLLDQFGWVLQIAVKKDAGLHDRHFHSASEGHLGAKIARMGDPEDMWICRRNLDNAVGAIVGASVIHENNLVIDVQFLERVGQPPMHDRYGLFILIAGHNR